MRNKQKVLLWLTKHDDNPLLRLIRDKYEVLSYLVFGVLTTLVNLVIFRVLEKIVGQDKWYVSNLPAILLAILFAYLTNRSFVFDSVGNFWTEMYKFFGARIIVSLVIEYGFSYLLYNIIGLDATLDLFIITISWFKIIALVFVLVANYLVSKFFVFKTK
jgi:putative flippase GtrA